MSCAKTVFTCCHFYKPSFSQRFFSQTVAFTNGRFQKLSLSQTAAFAKKYFSQNSPPAIAEARAQGRARHRQPR